MSKKLFKISTGYKDKETDSSNWDSYNIVAESGEMAFKKLKPKFRSGEYLLEIELIADNIVG